MKSVRIRSVRIQSKCPKIWTRKTPNTVTFLADKVIRAFCIVREFLSTLSSLSVRSTLNFVIVKVFTFYVKYILLIASY